MIEATYQKGRVRLTTQTMSGAAWLAWDRAMSDLGASAWSKTTPYRSVSIDALPAAVERLTADRLGLISYAPEVSPALRARADRFTPNIRGTDPRMERYQLEGIAYLRSRRAALLGDDMGLGKTAQMLQALENPREARVLVVCPALAKGVWRREAGLWAPGLRVTLLSGKGSIRWPNVGEAVVLNYDILPGAKDPLPYPPPRVTVMLDEVHYCKGISLRAKAAKRIVRDVRLAGGRAWGATGTPLDSKPPDLYHICETLGLEKEWGSWPNFIKLFHGRKHKFGYYWGRPEASVKGILERIMLRRKKSDVLNLPPVTHATRPVELDRAACADIDEALRRSGVRMEDLTVEALAQLATNPHLMTARRLLASSKLAAVIDWIEECEEVDEPCIVFSAHRGPIDALAQRPGWAAITGDTSPERRTEIAAAMQAGKLKGIAGTIRAMGVAITLTRPCLAAFVDWEWTPGVNQQARDRLHRMGQTRPVTIYSFVAEHPVDKRVEEILREKTQRQRATVDAITATPDSVRAEAMRRLADEIDSERM